MKIESVECFRMWGGSRNFLFVRIGTDRGIHGWGEGSAEWITGPVATAIEVYRELLVGRDPRDVVAITRDLVDRFPWRGGAVLNSAISAIDQALWDIAGKSYGLPVYKLLGGKVRNKIRAYTHFSLESPQAAISTIEPWRRRGFDAFKANPAEGRNGPLDHKAIEQVLTVLEAVRKEHGPDIDLMLDCHGSPSPPLGIALARAIEPYRPLFLEEPAKVGDVSALAEVAAASPVPIAAGEKLFTYLSFRELFEARAVAIAQPDVSHALGISGLRRIAELADSYQVLFAPHTVNGPVTLAASLQLCATLPNFLIQETMASAWELYNELLTEPLPLENGHFILRDDRPGLGVELREATIAAHPPQPMPVRQYRHDDGSWSGW